MVLPRAVMREHRGAHERGVRDLPFALPVPGIVRPSVLRCLAVDLLGRLRNQPPAEIPRRLRIDPIDVAALDAAGHQVGKTLKCQARDKRPADTIGLHRSQKTVLPTRKIRKIDMTLESDQKGNH